MKETNIEKCKEIARLFLELPVEVNPRLGLPYVYHPYTKYSCIVDKNGEMGDIVSNQKMLDYFKKNINEQIARTEKYSDFLFFLNDTYYMAFLKFTESFISKKDLSKYLSYAWVNSEYTNRNADLPKSQMIRIFSKTDKCALMGKENYNVYASLPQELTVYRGISIDDDKNIKALSWTLDKEQASWFATRFSRNGYVYEAKIDKKDIFAFFNDRNEQEIVLNYRKLKDIQKVQNVRRYERNKGLNGPIR